ncbi:MAG: hypothetical protein JWN98_1231 [Abditibacteriota bacterium]|nr:hypothetical protein [Abditibacteriota bacterium]
MTRCQGTTFESATTAKESAKVLWGDKHMKLKLSNRKSIGSLVALLLAGLAANAPAQGQLRVGQKMPAWSVRDLNGRLISSQAVKNKPVWITFFHST